MMLLLLLLSAASAVTADPTTFYAVMYFWASPLACFAPRRRSLPMTHTIKYADPTADAITPNTCPYQHHQGEMIIGNA